jgi:hypothetical protein
MKYDFKYSEELPQPIGNLQEDILEKFKALQNEALGIFISKNNHFKSIFIQQGISGIKTTLGHKIGDINNGSKTVDGKEIESLTECFIDAANYAIMGAILSHYDLEVQKRNRCDKCLYEIESRQNQKITLVCTRCFNKMTFLE